ncbi:hypothetical protein Q5752_006801 [Cryptotrichosporon argae]
MRLPPLAHLRRRLTRRALVALVLGLSLFVLAVSYFVLWRLEHGKFGRWYWNYLVSLHPYLAFVLPTGNWTPVAHAPRWVPEIFAAPWMGEYGVARLSRPVYRSGAGAGTGAHTSNDDSHGNDYEAVHAHTRIKHLASPSLVKLHVFSTVSETARSKRALIRRLSPLLAVPDEYRHLVEIKFVLGHAYRADWSVDDAMEAALEQEQAEYGDLLRLSLVHGENLREGKILDWIHAVGAGQDGGRDSWWLFKVDDDTVLNLPVFLDTLTTLNPHEPYYVGTSLNRWPAYHHHFTGMVTGFSWPLVKTLSAGIGNMSREEIEVWWDDDVLTGEIMFCLPSAPHCRPHPHAPQPAFCDPRAPPPLGWYAPPPDPDPRTGLRRHDFGRRMGDRDVWFLKNDVATHSWFFKSDDGYETEWVRTVKGRRWVVPAWLKEFKEELGLHV